MTTFYLDYENGHDYCSGSTWADAWQTTNGASASRVTSGDVVHIAKSPAPYSIGTATWTNLSKTILLDTPQTLIIDNCESLWTKNPSGDISSIANNSSNKEGTFCQYFSLDTTPQPSIMQAYKTISSSGSDVSGFQKLSFWLYTSSGSIMDSQWQIALCDDISGSSPVDIFEIPYVPSTSKFLPVTVARNGGGNCGSGIKSVALYTGSIVPKASSVIKIDNIIICTASGLNLQSLISKNSLEQGGDEGWYGIQSINGSIVILDNDTGTLPTTGQGYSGITENITTYIRETIKTAMATTNTATVQSIVYSGTLTGGNIEFQGGYNPSTDIQDGETFFDGQNGFGYGIYSNRQYILINNINMYRYYAGFAISGGSFHTFSRISNVNNNTYGLYLTQGANRNIINYIANANNNLLNGVLINLSSRNTIETIKNCNNNISHGTAMSSATNNTVGIVNANNNDIYGVGFTNSANNFIGTGSFAYNSIGGIYCSSAYDNKILNLYIRNSGVYAINSEYGSINYIYNSSISDAAVINFASIDYGVYYFNNYNLSSYPKIITNGATITAQLATAGGTGIEWKFDITYSIRSSTFPVKLQLAQIAVNPFSEVTVSCYFKKSHATDIAASLVCSGSQISGVEDTVHTNCPSDTNRNLVTVQFTPTEKGVVAIEVWAWWVDNLADENVIVDDISISQP